MLFIAATVGAFLGALGLTPAIRSLAHATGRVARPSQDRWHSRPTALLGGIAIYGGFLIGLVALFGLEFFRSGAVSASRPVLAIVISATIMFATGVADDLLRLRPASKLVPQAIAGAALVTMGVHFSLTPFPLVNAVFTLFWFIGLTNALNLLDNMDGVTTGVTSIGAAFLAILLGLQGQVVLAALALALAGATAGFLPYNFRPASIFMGDSGSLFLGACLAGLGAAYSTAAFENPVAAIAVPVLVSAVPIFDTTLVTFTRTLARYAVTQGGRDHVAHRLVGMGLTERQTALLLYAFAAVGGTFALLIGRGESRIAGPWLAALFVMGLLAFGAYLSRLYSYPPEGARPESRLSRLLEELVLRRRALEVIFDLFLFAVAYSGAYLLRYDITLPRAQLELLIGTVGIAAACKSVAFGLMGVYRGVWHQSSIADLNRLLKATALGSLLTVAVVVFGFRESEFSRTVFVLDAMLVVLLAAGARVSFRSLDRVRHRLLHTMRGSNRPTLIYGAGRGGEFAVRELYANPALNLEPVGFIDDDPAKQKCLILGLPVMGSSAGLREVIQRHGITQLIISTKKVSDAQWQEIVRLCTENGVDLMALEIRLAVLAPQPVEVRQQVGS